MARTSEGLTHKQLRFVNEYIKDLNATRAAMRAGYAPNNAEVQGHHLVKKPQVQAAIQLRLDARAKRTEVHADRVIREFARIAFADMRQFAEWSGQSLNLLPSEQLEDDDSAAVAEVAQTSSKFGSNVRIKLHDKGRALEKLGDHLGLWKKDPAELLELFLASLPPSVAGIIRAGIQQQVSGGGPPGADAGDSGGAEGVGGEPVSE